MPSSSHELAPVPHQHSNWIKVSSSESSDSLKLNLSSLHLKQTAELRWADGLVVRAELLRAIDLVVVAELLHAVDLVVGGHKLLHMLRTQIDLKGFSIRLLSQIPIPKSILI